MEDVIVQESPIPDDIERYAGKWVAIRDRKVIVTADSLEELRDDPRVRSDDALWSVPPAGPTFY